MRISTKGIYALEIVTDIAMHTEEHAESLKNIAIRRNLSQKYLERIVKTMKDCGIVTSSRGAYGGYKLSREPEDIKVIEVLNAVEGELAPVDCLTRETECGIDCNCCPTRAVWAGMWHLIQDVAGEVTIKDITERSKNICN